MAICEASRERLSRLAVSPLPGKCGTRANYKRGCKCLRCRAANSRYEAERDAARRNGDTREIVSAEAARKHIHTLSRAGIGYRIVADEAKVALSVVAGIRAGRRPQCRANTARAILAVTPNTLRGDHSLIDGAPTWRLIDELLSDGYTKRQIATWFYGRHTLTIQFQRARVTVRTAAKIKKLYEDVRAGKLRRDR